MTALGRLGVTLSRAQSLNAARRDGEVGALVQWWRELADGTRTRMQSDVLWWAACWEARGREMEGLGLLESAAECRLFAGEIIREACGSARGAA